MLQLATIERAESHGSGRPRYADARQVASVVAG